MAHPLSLEKNRLAYLALLTAANAFIGFSPLSPGLKIAIGLFGILLPLYVAVRTGPRGGKVPGALPDLKFSIPLPLLLVALVLTLALRFHDLTDFVRWPNLDEGWIGMNALSLSHAWDWRFFYTFGETPPLTVWCVALLLKLGASLPFSFWFPPALASLAAVPVAYFTARRYFTASIAGIVTGLMALSHWPLFIGRHCHQGIWLPLWICLFFLAWGKFRDSEPGPSRIRWAAGTGAALGLGSFTFTPWIPVAGLLLAWALWTLWRSQGARIPSRTIKKRPKHSPSPLAGEGRVRGKQYLPAFLAGFLLALLPFLIAVAREGYGHHIASLSPWGGWFKEFALATGLFKYFAVLVWGAFEKDPAYVPVWGGFLNPLLGAFFFLGAVEMIRRRRQGTVRFLAAAFVLFLFPGALSPNLEGFRIAQVLPLLLVITAFGLHSFLAALPGRGRVLILTVVLAATAAFDHERMSRPYRDPGSHPEDFGRPLRSAEKHRAYQLVVPNIAGLGSGNLYAHFQDDAYNDPTFALMVSPFNAADPWGAAASDFTSKQPGWEAFIVDRHFRPFLSARFPGARWFPLPGEGVLVILSRGEVGSWPEFHRILQKADRERFAQTRADFDPLLRSLLEAGPLIQGDPFLASLFWDKVAAYQYERLDYAGQLEAHRRAIEEGYPAAHLYFKLGQLLLVGRDVEGAREAFQKALRAPENGTDARAWLDRLESAKTE